MVLFIIHHLKPTYNMSHVRPLEGTPHEDACHRCVLCNQDTTVGKRFCMGPAMFACVKCAIKVSARKARMFASDYGYRFIKDTLNKGDYLSIKEITGTCVHAIILEALVWRNKTDLVAKIQATLYKRL